MEYLNTEVVVKFVRKVFAGISAIDPAFWTDSGLLPRDMERDWEGGESKRISTACTELVPCLKDTSRSVTDIVLQHPVVTLVFVASTSTREEALPRLLCTAQYTSYTVDG